MEGLYEEMIRERYKEDNNKISHRIRNKSLTLIKVAAGCPTNDAERDIYFSLRGDDWQGLNELGKCIGSTTTHLKHLKLHMDLRGDMPDEDDDDYDDMIPTKHYQRMTHFWDDLISALSNCLLLKVVKIRYMELMGEESGDIFEVLRQHQPQLEVLEYPGNSLSRRSGEGEEALTNLLRDSNQLHTLDVSRNGIVGESLQEGLLQYLGKLSCLNLSYNMLSINDFDGYQAIATLLGDPSCNLHELTLNGSNIQGERLRSFARAMTKNKTLMILDLSRNSINAADWAVFSNVLCDTSSVNNTYKSNHKLWQLVKDGPVISFQGAPGSHQNRERLPGLIPHYLDLNKYDDKKKVAALKILQYSRHNITMLPFFEWELSCLPIAVNWFDNAAPYYRRPPVFRKEVETSKLQAIYEFVRGMPVECSDGYFGRNKKGSKKRARS